MQVRQARGVPGQSRSATVLFTRINAIIDMLPEDFPKRKKLIAALRDRQDSIWYTAPEVVPERWNEVGQILYDFIPTESEIDRQVSELFGKAFSE